MSVKKLNSFLKLKNIAEELSEEELQNIGNRVIAGFKEDESSQQEWMNDVLEVEKLASLSCEKKNTPIPDASNIKHPLITKAIIEFSSRTYPEIIRDGRIVKGAVIGKDDFGEKAEKAERTSAYMNYQLLIESQEWELELDRLLNLLALVGFVCKKTYYDPLKDTVKSEICDYKDLVINSEVKSLDDARRISHVIHNRLNDLIESSRAGLFLKDTVEEEIKAHKDDELDPEICLIEQHTFLDLDDDMYAEPYIVTVLKETGKVLRITPRFDEKGIYEGDKSDEVKCIHAIQYFVDYHFLVSPKGKFQSVGFGILMLHLNNAINTILNQLIDAGRLANLQGGYMDSRIKSVGSGVEEFAPGQWVKKKVMSGVELKNGIVPINYKEPSAVLFQLLGLLIDVSRDLSSSTEIMTGQQQPDNVKTGATMALIQEGTKIFTSIQKRLYRSLANEFKKIFLLNSMYLEPEHYFNVHDDEKAVKQTDFDVDSVDIIPVADPNLASDTQRRAKAEFLLATIGLPGVKAPAITRRVYTEAHIPNLEELLMSEEELAQATQQPNPEIIQIQADIEAKAQEINLKGKELELEQQRIQSELYKTQCECLKIKADAILSIAKAESLEAGDQAQLYMKQLDMLSQNIENQMRITEMQHESDILDKEQIHESDIQAKEQAAANQMSSGESNA